ncbi:MAG: hypothetical protein U9Q92_06105 [archaeon]|nr:hypothetical protein [archaeon]
MTSIEEHKKAVNELESDMLEKIRLNLVSERQKIIGFVASEASANCFAILLHKRNLISAGFNVNHRWFASIERAGDKFPFDFPHKDKLLELLVKQENLRHRLCYGRSKSAGEAEEAIEIFFEIKRIVEEDIGEDL